MIKKLLIICILVSGISISKAQTALPLSVPDEQILPLRSLINGNFQKNLEQELNKNKRWKNLIANKKLAVGVVDLRNPEKAMFARINGGHMMYAASLPKIAILLAAMDAIEKGELKETEAVTKDLRLMISKSDNKASTRMIDRLGYEKIEAVMTNPNYEFYDEEYGGGLWVGKRYGGGGDTNREPLKNLSHAASVTQVCRFYYLLAHGKLVNERRSRQMLKIMENPEIHHKLVNSLRKMAPAARLFRKSGSWRSYHSDSILVWGKDPNRRYILVVLADAEDGETIIRNLVAPVERVLKKTPTTL